MATTPHVDTWDLKGYPDKHNNHAGSDVYRFIVLDKNGTVEWKNVPEGTRPINKKVYDVAGLGTSNQTEVKKLKCRWGINPADIRTAEEWIQGKPTLVQMALWYTPTFREDGAIVKWTPMKRTGEGSHVRPEHWLDVTETYYRAWRPAAYKDDPDPYVDQKRPVTRMMELEAEVAALKKQVPVK